MASPVFDKGDVVWIECDPQTGREQKGHRLALILSPASYNGKTGLAVMCPITSKVKGYGQEVAVSQAGGVEGAVLCDQLKSFDWRARRARFFCVMPSAVTQQVVDKVKVFLG